MNITANIHDLMPFIIFLVVLPLSLYLGHRRNETNKRKLRDVALKLGLQYSENAPAGPSLDALTIRSNDPAQTQQRLRRLEKGGVLARALQTMAPAAVTGKYNGCAVDIRTQRRDKKTYTVFTAWFTAPLGLGLKVSPNSFLQRDLGFGGKSRIESGDDAFDRKVLVKGADEMKVKYLVKRPEVRKALLDLYSAQSDTMIDDSSIVCRVQKDLKDFLAYQAVLGLLTAAVRQLKPE
jgi:hypothetical protein